MVSPNVPTTAAKLNDGVSGLGDALLKLRAFAPETEDGRGQDVGVLGGQSDGVGVVFA